MFNSKVVNISDYKSDISNTLLHPSDCHRFPHPSQLTYSHYFELCSASYIKAINGRQWQTNAVVSNQLLPRKWTSLFFNQSQNYVGIYIGNHIEGYILLWFGPRSYIWKLPFGLLCGSLCLKFLLSDVLVERPVVCPASGMPRSATEIHPLKGWFSAARRMENIKISSEADSERLIIKKIRFQCWKDLIGEIEKDSWGLAFKIVTKRLLTRRKTSGLDNPDQVKYIVQSLFPHVELFMFRCEELFTLEELKRAGGRLKANTALAIDGVPDEILKKVIVVYPQILLESFNFCLWKGKFFDEWKRQRLLLLRRLLRSFSSGRCLIL